MFTGIIQAIGRLEASETRGGDRRMVFSTGELSTAGLTAGDSIAVNGACLTAVALEDNGFTADVSTETLALTTLGVLVPGDPVNLEPALSAGQALGGHLVSGHVDGVGEVVSHRDDGRSVRFDLAVPPALARYIAVKGSVCVDGVSLTVNHVEGDRFGVNIVPHTLSHTIFGKYQPGTRVNLEVDMIARYLERLLEARIPTK
ncbi:MAG: riboflavin synthase [Pseudomonadota bacterium]